MTEKHLRGRLIYVVYHLSNSGISRGRPQMTSSALEGEGCLQIIMADEGGGGFAEDEVIYNNHFRANFCQFYY